jgi:acetyl esterase/lipase
MLDVVVSKKVWDDLQKNEGYSGKMFYQTYHESEFIEYIVSVIVWFHGGGFTYGDKNQGGSPVGLFNAAREVGEDVIWVCVRFDVIE